MTVRRRAPIAVESSDDEDGVSPDSLRYQNSKSLSQLPTGQEVATAESRSRKIIVRALVGFAMVSGFLGIVWAGHLYLSALVVLIQVRQWTFAWTISLM